MKRVEEEYCKDTFDNFLSSNFHGITTTWTEVEQKDEPPDYYLDVSGEIYAVEVTILMTELKSEGVNQPIASVYALHNRLEAIIKAESSKLGVLDGAYTISINKPIPGLRDKLSEIKTQAVGYITDNYGKLSADERIIYEINKITVKIKKIHNTKDYVAINGPTLVKWKGEAGREIIQILQKSIERKSHKLRNISHKKLLLLYDGYHFADPQQYMSCIELIDKRIDFNAIFIVQQGYDGFFLFKKDCFVCNETK